MSSKSKHPAGQPTTVTLYQQGLRHLQKRDFKQALKDARVCYRQAGTPEHRQFLEQAAIARARELQQGGLTPQAIDILQELLAMPLQDLAVRNATPELLHKLGILERYPQYRASLEADPELQARLTRQAVDNSVIHPQGSPNATQEVRETGARIRQAWELVTAGREAEGLELLQDIPRQSPFADWRLFIRGLAAYYRHDAETQLANWERLTTKRIPARLAMLLMLWREPSRVEGLDPQQALELDGLERAVWGVPLLGDLAVIESRSAKGNWHAVVAVLGRIRPQMRRHAPETFLAITKIVREHCIVDGSEDLLVGLKRHTDPLVSDPHWHQAEALVMESNENRTNGPQTRANFDTVNSHWKHYLQDLELLPTLSDDDRRLGRSLIWTHLGQRYGRLYQANTADIDSDGEDPADVDPEDRLENEELYADAMTCFEKSLVELPDLLPAHTARCEFLEDIERFVESQAARLALLKWHPNDFESLLEVVDEYVAREKYTEALPYVERLLNLKPLDIHVQRFARSTVSELAREAARKRQWDAGRGLFDKLAWDCEDLANCFRLVRRGIFETAAGCTESADGYFAAALRNFPSPGLMGLLQTIEGTRYRLPKARCADYQQQWESLLREPFDPAAASVMCWIMLEYLSGEISYAGRPAHIKLLAAYLKRGTKARFEADDLTTICTLLSQLKNQKTLLRTYALRGKGLHPKKPFFRMLLAQFEIEKGPHRCKLRTVEQHLKVVLKHADPDKDEIIIEAARQMQKCVEAWQYQRFFGGFPGSFRDSFQREFDDFEL